MEMIKMRETELRYVTPCILYYQSREPRQYYRLYSAARCVEWDTYLCGRACYNVLIHFTDTR